MEIYNEAQRFISFTSDYGFKATFGNENNSVFLRKALQALIASENEIVEVSFDKNTFDGITRDARSGIFDLLCKDEKGNVFIVEMQLSTFKYFLQRLKFYTAQKFNTLVKKGDFDYKNLPKIYAIAILAENISDHAAYHNIGSLKNQYGEVMDEQTIYITVELGKFTLQEQECTTDLEKLLYTMKTINTEYIASEQVRYPKFWTEEWLRFAISELDTRAMSPEKRMVYEMTLSNNAEAIRQENEKIEKAKLEGMEKGMEKGIEKGREEAVSEKDKQFTESLLLSTDFDDAQIALLVGATVEYVAEIRKSVQR